MKVIRAGAEHLSDLVEMASLLWRDEDVVSLQETFRKVLTSKEKRTYLCVDDNEQAVAFIYVALRYESVQGARETPVGYIEGLYVQPEYRRQGIAHLLIHEASNWAYKKGAEQLASNAQAENELSIDFHKAVGFSEVGRVACFIMDIKND